MKKTYLARYGADKKWTALSLPREGTRNIVVIPALAESSHLFHTLKSLAANPPRDLAETVVLVVINNREKNFLGPGQWEDNHRTLRILRDLAAGNTPPGGLLDPSAEAAAASLPGRLNLAVVDASSPGRELPDKTGGVGLARKIGLDRALDILSPRDGERGLLFCLDADTLVKGDYLPSVQNFFREKGPGAGVIRFRHRRPGDTEERRAIVCYEIFLRYYVLGLKSARSPYAFHTVGSTMVFRPEAYVAVRGMNRRKGGEDFYFLNKLAKVTAVGDIRSTTVYPSPRRSGRVPFGTGRRVLRFLEEKYDEYILYHPRVFSLLESWLRVVCRNPAENEKTLLAAAGEIHPAVRTFLEERDFPAAWGKIRRNAKDERQLIRQFHGWFDGFETFKFIRFLSEAAFPPVSMFEALEVFFKAFKASFPTAPGRPPIPSLEMQEEILTAMERFEEGLPPPA